MQEFLEFTRTLGELKKLERFKGHYFWRDYPEEKRYESVADHSWRLAMLVLMFEKRLSQPIDLGKTLTMALIHDIAEIDAGDASPTGEDGTGQNTHAFNPERQKERHTEERVAAERIFGQLPIETGKRLLDLWTECEEQTSFEGKVIKALDKIEAMQQVLEYRDGHVFPEHLKFNISYGLKYADVDPAIKEFGDALAEEMRTRYKPFNK